MGAWQFWLATAVVAVASLAVALLPLLRGRAHAARRASFDLQVFRDQLREIEADRARGLLTEAEAEATATEVSRRLLAAAEAEAAESATTVAPGGLSRRVAIAAGALGLVMAGALYGTLGAPGYRDQPQGERLAAMRPSQEAAEAAVAAQGPQSTASPQDAELIGRLETVLAGRPEDIDGRRLLARSLASVNSWREARAAQAEVVAVLGDRVAAQDLVDLAELGIMAAAGYVSPESEAALARALTLDPRHTIGRYYSALALMQAGRPDLAQATLEGLLAEGGLDPQLEASVLAGIARVARDAGPPAPGPGAADLEAAAAMSPEERQAMIEGMVQGLGDRLAAEGGPAEDWARLIRALGVLGRTEEAVGIAAEARATFAADPTSLAAIEAAARDAGVSP